MNQSVQLTQAMLDQAPSAKAVLEIDTVQKNWVATYRKLSGREDGEQRFEAEKIMFLQTVGKTKALAECNKFSIYAAFIELSISGLSLRDGLTYIIPRGGVATFMVGWKGRLEQLNEMETVVYVHEPQVVHAADDFEYELGQNPRIIRHKPAIAADKGPIVMVYLVIEYTHGTKCFFMTAEEVLNIRDTRSDTYKSYKKKVDSGKFEDWMEKPMWVTDEIQAYKKTIVKRVYNTSTKLPKHKLIDDRMTKAIVDEDADDLANNNVPNPAAQEVNLDEALNIEGSVGNGSKEPEQSHNEPESKQSDNASAAPTEPKSEALEMF